MRRRIGELEVQGGARDGNLGGGEGENRGIATRWAEQTGEILSKKTFGEDGPDLITSLADMERVLGPLLEQFAAGFLRGSIVQQGERLPDEVPCPSCGQGCVPETADKPRRVTTEHGDVRWQERACFCDRCERSFFPSAAGAQD